MKQLSAAAGHLAPHLNVLGYLDSWEEDQQLYILTELCRAGNLAHFLEATGREFPRLDEGRVWKILAELSNVSIWVSARIHGDLGKSSIAGLRFDCETAIGSY